MSNRDLLVDGLHSILAELWDGSDEIAATEFRRLMVWRLRTAKQTVPPYRVGTFPAPVLQDAPDQKLLESAASGMQSIEAAFQAGDSGDIAQRVKELLAFLSEPQPA